MKAAMKAHLSDTYEKIATFPVELVALMSSLYGPLCQCWKSTLDELKGQRSNIFILYIVWIQKP